MDPHVSRTGVVASPQIPRVMGILNIFFASTLMVCGLCTLASAALYPMWQAVMTKLEADMRKQEDKDRKAALERIEADAQDAQTDQQKLEIENRRKEVENRPRLSQTLKMDLKSAGLDDSRLIGFLWVEYLTSLVLNLLMLGAGIGLVMQRTWGLKLGLWTAALKIVRLVLVYGYMAFVIAPVASQAIGKMAVQQVAMQQKAMKGATPPPAAMAEMVTKIYAVMITSYAATVIVVGSIYPAVSLWLLSRPRAWAACLDTRKAKGTAESW